MTASDAPRRHPGPLTPNLHFHSNEGLTPLRPEPPTPATGLAPLGPADGLRGLDTDRIVPPGRADDDQSATVGVMANARRRAMELDWDNRVTK